MNNEAKPFTPETQVIARLLEAAGFRLSRGTYVGEHADHPTLCIDRPSCPLWPGVWDMSVLEECEDVDALSLAREAIDSWEAWSQS